MTSDWAKNLAARKKLELEKKDLQQEKDLSDRKLLVANAGRMWLELCEAVQKDVAELNFEMGREYITYENVQDALGRKGFNLRTGERGTYPVSFAPEMWLVNAQGNTFTLAVIEGNGVVWKNAHGAGLPSSSIAQIIVSSAFG
jgi:hypothetical protein